MTPATTPLVVFCHRFFCKQVASCPVNSTACDPTDVTSCTLQVTTRCPAGTTTEDDVTICNPNPLNCNCTTGTCRDSSTNNCPSYPNPEGTNFATAVPNNAGQFPKCQCLFDKDCIKAALGNCIGALS